MVDYRGAANLDLAFWKEHVQNVLDEVAVVLCIFHPEDLDRVHEDTDFDAGWTKEQAQNE